MILFDYILLVNLIALTLIALMLWAHGSWLFRRLGLPTPKHYSAKDTATSPASWPSARTGSVSEQNDPIWPVTH